MMVLFYSGQDLGGPGIFLDAVQVSGPVIKSRVLNQTLTVETCSLMCFSKRDGVGGCEACSSLS